MKAMTKREAVDQMKSEMYCGGCHKLLTAKRPLYDTAWSGIYWCGSKKCAYEIMETECQDTITFEDTVNLWMGV